MLPVPDAIPRGRFLTKQERQFVGLYAQGMSAKAAARAAGYMLVEAVELLKRQDVVESIAAMRERMNEELGVVITRDFVGAMILEAHKKAASATEELAAARDLAKLYGLNAPERTVSVQYNVSRVEQLEGLPEAELARLAGYDANAFALPPPIDAEPVEAGEPAEEPAE